MASFSNISLEALVSEESNITNNLLQQILNNRYEEEKNQCPERNSCACSRETFSPYSALPHARNCNLAMENMLSRTCKEMYYYELFQYFVVTNYYRTSTSKRIIVYALFS